MSRKRRDYDYPQKDEPQMTSAGRDIANFLDQGGRIQWLPPGASAQPLKAIKDFGRDSYPSRVINKPRMVK